MADLTINQLTALTTPADADEFAIYDADESSVEPTKKITYANLAIALGSGGSTTAYIYHPSVGTLSLVNPISLVYANADATLPAITDDVQIVIFFVLTSGSPITVTPAGGNYIKGAEVSPYTIDIESQEVLILASDGDYLWYPIGHIADYSAVITPTP